MGKILGLDYGCARVGLAITDALKITAQGIDSLETKGNNKILIEKIKQINKETPLEEIVIGYPLHMNGEKSLISEEIDQVIKKIEEIGISVYRWDERLTTVNAYKTMKDMGIKQTQKKKYADRLAATYILEDYLAYKEQK